MLFIWFCAAAVVSGEVLFDHAASSALLQKKPIRLNATGSAELSFGEACQILNRDDLLEAVQRGYAQTLPPDKEPEFTVTKLPDGTYYYMNRNQQETRIEEVGRVQDEKRVEVALYSEGVRFFGPYESFCIVRVMPDGPERVTYEIEVYARPDSAVFRFFAKMAPVEMFFKHKTRSLTDMVLSVCDQILKLDADMAQTGGTCQFGGKG